MTHEDGVYFGLDEQAYRDDPALGYTDHKKLVVNPARWQFERLRELRTDLGLPPPPEDDANKAKRSMKAFGTALDILVLDGKDAFERRYCEALDPPDDMPGTCDQLREALLPYWRDDPGARALPKSAARPDLVNEARHYGVRTTDDWRADEAERRAGREVLSLRWAAQLRLIDYLLDVPRNDHGGKSIRQRALTNGMAQVSVFWTVQTVLGPVRLKARFDWLRPSIITDLKSFGAQDDRELVDAFCGKVKDFAYEMQAAHYTEAREQIPTLVLHGKVYGDHDPAWLAKLVAYTGAQTWRWLTVQTISLPEIDIMELPYTTTTYLSGRAHVEHARQRYAQLRDQFGEDELWINQRGRIVLEDINFNPNITSRGAERWKPAGSGA
jgi:hypothetical protein